MLLNEWFLVKGKLRMTSEFVNVSSDAIERIQFGRTWFEWKVLDQYLLIFEQCLKEAVRDACYLIAINSRQIAEKMLEHNDLPASVVVGPFSLFF